MKGIVLIGLLVFSSCMVNNYEAELVTKMNNMNTTWKASLKSGISKDKVKILLGVLPEGNIDHLKLKTPKILNDLPKELDLRKEHPYCKSIGEIPDQANCGSCWAVAAAAVMTDRLCIKSKGRITTPISSENLITCCYNCGYGCGGGFPSEAFIEWNRPGVPSGGAYGNKKTCKPYFLPPCNHLSRAETKYDECPERSETPNCHEVCINDYPRDIKDDYTRGEPYILDGNNVEELMTDLLENGPLEATFEVFEDFPYYESGVYKKTIYKTSLGGHAVKIIGWGEEDGVPYWLCVNSWNEEWGDHGIFKILRGENECDIETPMYGGHPILDDE